MFRKPRKKPKKEEARTIPTFLYPADEEWDKLLADVTEPPEGVTSTAFYNSLYYADEDVRYN